MSRLDKLKEKIDALYLSKNADRADWADWLFANHIYAVAEQAGILADRFGANSELAMAAAMLHDVADVVMKRENPDHEEKSIEIAKRLLVETGYSDSEIATITGDAMRNHGCRDGKAPKTLEGKVLATADALVHLRSDFYGYAARELKRVEPIDEVRGWAMPKVERDYNKKIQFESIREDVRPDYEKIKAYLEKELN